MRDHSPLVICLCTTLGVWALWAACDSDLAASFDGTLWTGRQCREARPPRAPGPVADPRKKTVWHRDRTAKGYRLESMDYFEVYVSADVYEKVQVGNKFVSNRWAYLGRPAEVILYDTTP